MNTLNQRYGLNFKKFEILDNGVKVSDRYLWNYFECALSFEEILNKEIFEKRRSFFLNKYVSDSFEQDEKLRSLNWLYEKEIIDLDEFNKQKKKLSSGSLGGF